MACSTGGRHWFTYYGWPGSSSPVCVRYGCSVPNPRYDPSRDYARTEYRTEPPDPLLDAVRYRQGDDAR